MSTLPHAFPDSTLEPRVEKITVWIQKTRHSYQRMFFCMICRTGIFKYKGSIVTVVPGDADSEGQEVLSFPFEARCKGNSMKYGKCPAVYIVQGYTEELEDVQS